MAQYITYKYEQLNKLCNDAFAKLGFEKDECQIISGVLLLSDLYGIESHGMQRLVRYHKGIEKGLIKVEAKPEVVFETPVSAVIDGHYGMGSTDAARVLHDIVSKEGGGILPLGGEEEKTGSHKGYGYGMFVEIFCSILSMGITSNHTHIGNKSGTCHGFIAIDPKVFGNAAAIKEHFSRFLQELRESAKALGQNRIYTHGEKKHFANDDRMKNGIPVNVNTVAEMKSFCEFAGLDVEEYLGSEAVNLKEKESSYK